MKINNVKYTSIGYLQEEVDEGLVAHIVSKWTGIPVSKMLEGEAQRLMTLEKEIEKSKLEEGALKQLLNDVVLSALSEKIKLKGLKLNELLI